MPYMAGKVRHAWRSGGIQGAVGSGPGREQALSALADRQYGVVGQSQLAAMGLGERTIARWAAVGRLHKIHRGAYAVGRRSVVQRGTWLAAVLACGEGAVLSHASAAALWELVPARSLVDVTSPRGNQGRKRWRGIRLHRGRLDLDETTFLQHRIPVTSVARTLFDYAEVVDFRRLENAWEEADRLKLLRLREIERVCERGYGRHALKPIRRLLAEAHAVTRTRSPLEDRFQRFARGYDLPPHSTTSRSSARRSTFSGPRPSSSSSSTAGNSTATAPPSDATEPATAASSSPATAPPASPTTAWTRKPTS
jgi:predicted transcriptional regulator of viral defense system